MAGQILWPIFFYMGKRKERNNHLERGICAVLSISKGHDVSYIASLSNSNLSLVSGNTTI